MDNIGTSSCKIFTGAFSEDVPLCKVGYNQGRYSYNLEIQPEVKINLLDSKRVFNSISNRNLARSVFAEKVHSMIDIIEHHAQYLTAADKREFKEAFQELLKEI